MISKRSAYLQILLLSLAGICCGWAPTSKKNLKTVSTSPTLFYKDASFAPFTENESPPKIAVNPHTNTFSKEFSIAGKLPWLESDSKIREEEDPIFLSHWNWQLDYFQRELTNLSINKCSKHDTTGKEENDLYYVNDGKGHHVYTISLKSEEYRDIRMTYMKFPTSQIFRCLAYPSDGSLPVMGMGIMKFGVAESAKHMAILDYQPLTAAASCGESESQSALLSQEYAMEDLFTSKLLRMRAEIPSMSQPMTHRHFDTEEERKYFTETPLLGRWTTSADSEVNDSEQEKDLDRAQKEFVTTHVQLTQKHRMRTRTQGRNHEDDVVTKHSQFDTHVSLREPAGRFLCSAYGSELGHKLVHEVIFPLSTVPPPSSEPSLKSELE